MALKILLQRSRTFQAENCKRIVRDKFLITAVFLESGELDQAKLLEAQKTQSPDGHYRLRCQLAGSGAKEVSGVLSNAQKSATVETGCTRQVSKLLKKFTR